MKKLIGLFLILVIMASCADGKKFQKKDGPLFYAKPYGWFNLEDKIDGVIYEVNVGNMVWNVILFETVVVPVVLTGAELYEPVDYVEPENNVVKP